MNPHLAIVALAAILVTAPAAAADIKVLASPGVREAYNELVPQFEKASGHHVITIWDGVVNVTKRIAEGESADVVILPLAQIDELTAKGKLVAGSRIDVAKSGVGVAIKAGVPKPRLRNGDDLKAALLKAKKIAFSTGPSGVYIQRLMQQWGIWDTVKDRTVIPSVDTPVGIAIANGDADIGFQQVSELIHVKGITFLGPIPADVQETTVFAAGLHKDVTMPAAARAFMLFLGAPRAAESFRKAGMEPGS
jgi:molybdate transport system substrate-binding protein